MRVDDRRLAIRLGRPLAIVLLALAVIAGPTWLWLARGRKPALHVVLRADRYVAPVGASIEIEAHTRSPEGAAVELYWSDPELTDKGSRVRWKPPARAGVHPLSVEARLAGSIATDTISVQIEEELTLERVPRLTAPAPPRDISRCAELAAAAPQIRLHGDSCRGASIVAELLDPEPNKVWFWWEHDPAKVHTGRVVGLRVPASDATSIPLRRATATGSIQLRVVALWLDTRETCTRTAAIAVTIDSCRAGPRRSGLFADFGWQLIGPSTFRLAAKPPRMKDSPAISYVWTLEPGLPPLTTHKAVLVHRFRQPRRYHIVGLSVRASDRRMSTTKLLTDRTAAPD